MFAARGTECQAVVELSLSLAALPPRLLLRRAGVCTAVAARPFRCCLLSRDCRRRVGTCRGGFIHGEREARERVRRERRVLAGASRLGSVSGRERGRESCVCGDVLASAGFCGCTRVPEAHCNRSCLVAQGSAAPGASGRNTGSRNMEEQQPHGAVLEVLLPAQACVQQASPEEPRPLTFLRVQASKRPRLCSPQQLAAHHNAGCSDLSSAESAPRWDACSPCRWSLRATEGSR